MRPLPVVNTMVRWRDAVDRAEAFLGSCDDPRGLPPALVALDPAFNEAIRPARVRSVARHRLGVDIGFDLGDEAFSAMSALTLLPPHGPTSPLADRLVRFVEHSRRGHRYSFFVDVPEFAADTDCTALAGAALYRWGRRTAGDLARTAAELLSAAADVDQGDELRRGVLMVYWEDGAEPAALPRGRKHDAVACANALFTVKLAGVPGHPVIRETLRYLLNHLTTERYRRGTRYYPSPDAFLYAASRLCARFADCARVLGRPLRTAVSERPAAAGGSGPLSLALRVVAADNLGVRRHQAERRSLLAGLQARDGSWPASPYFRMGRVPVYFGSRQLTTLFAARALRPPA